MPGLSSKTADHSDGRSFRRLCLALASVGTMSAPALAQPARQLPAPIGTVFQRMMTAVCDTGNQNCSVQAILYRDRLDGSNVLRLQAAPSKDVNQTWTVCELSHGEAVRYPMDRPGDARAVDIGEMGYVAQLMNATDVQTNSREQFTKNLSAINDALPKAAQECLGHHHI